MVMWTSAVVGAWTACLLAWTAGVVSANDTPSQNDLKDDWWFEELDTQPQMLWSQGDIRLVSSFESDYTSPMGRLELFFASQYAAGSGDSGGTWGTVCGKGFTSTAANVACRQLGFESVLDWNYVSNTSINVVNDSVPIFLDEVRCPASYLWHMMRCNINHFQSSDSDCTHDDDVVLLCNSVRIWDNPYNGQVRLIGFNNATMLSYGRVEVFQNGWWGTVCNEGFNQAGADSVCRQLGYTGAMYTGDALPGDGIISVKGMTCDSSSPCFTSCYKHHLHINDCNHTQDVAVQCDFNLNDVSENTAGYSNTCSLSNFPVSLLILCIFMSLGFLLALGFAIVLLITFTRCCVKRQCLCCSNKEYIELY